MLYEEEETIFKLDLDYIEAIAKARSEDAHLDWELCTQCYDKFLDWVQKMQNQGDRIK